MSGFWLMVTRWLQADSGIVMASGSPLKSTRLLVGTGFAKTIVHLEPCCPASFPCPIPCKTLEVLPDGF